jgi:hypothetical protein
MDNWCCKGSTYICLMYTYEEHWVWLAGRAVITSGGACSFWRMQHRPCEPGSTKWHCLTNWLASQTYKVLYVTWLLAEQV